MKSTYCGLLKILKSSAEETLQRYEKYFHLSYHPTDGEHLRVSSPVTLTLARSTPGMTSTEKGDLGTTELP